LNFTRQNRRSVRLLPGNPLLQEVFQCGFECRWIGLHLAGIASCPVYTSPLTSRPVWKILRPGNFNPSGRYPRYGIASNPVRSPSGYPSRSVESVPGSFARTRVGRPFREFLPSSDPVPFLALPFRSTLPLDVFPFQRYRVRHGIASGQIPTPIRTRKHSPGEVSVGIFIELRGLAPGELLPVWCRSRQDENPVRSVSGLGCILSEKSGYQGIASNPACQSLEMG
jgi:hypothetical protein